MLRRLEIRGLVVFERAELDLAPGLTAVTGESGAGKSVLMRALALLAGAPADAGLVRPGHSHALVQATLALPDGFWDRLDDDDPARALRELVEAEDEVVVARRIPAEGRARAYVDGQAVSRDAVAALVGHRVRFCGQGEQRRLVSAARQTAVLDAFAGTAGDAGRLDVLRRRVRALDREIAAAAERRADAARRRTELEDLVAAVAELDPDPQELAALRTERERLRHADRLAAGAAAALAAVSPPDGEGGAAAAVATGLGALAGLADLDPALGEPVEHLAAAEASLQEAAISLSRYADGLEAEPGRLQFVEDRIDAYVRTERRFGATVDELIERAERARDDLAAIDAGGEADAALAARRADALAAARQAADALHSARASAADPLARAVSAVLAELAMADGALRVEVGRDAAEVPRDQVAFWFRPNPGLPEAPLAEAASGGELSRVLLALSTVAAAGDDATWVFDEVDAGVGGRTAAAVADNLTRLGLQGQTLVISHQAVVAAAATSLLMLDKHTDTDVATTDVVPLSGARAEAEIARLLGGTEDDAEALRHARSLLAG